MAQTPITNAVWAVTGDPIPPLWVSQETLAQIAAFTESQLIRPTQTTSHQMLHMRWETDPTPRCQECPICWESFTEQASAIKTRCGHNFHKACIEEHMVRSKDTGKYTDIVKCPMCRNAL